MGSADQSGASADHTGVHATTQESGIRTDNLGAPEFMGRSFGVESLMTHQAKLIRLAIGTYVNVH